MNQMVATRMLSPVEEFVEQILDRDRMDELAGGLPSHIKPAMFKRNLLNAVMINPDLMEFKPGLLFREVSKAAALGLFLDPHLGEAYIVVAYNYKTKSKEPQLRIGYRGLIKLARQSGEVTAVYAHEVHAKDHFVCKLGTEKTLIHEPMMFGDRGEVIGYYAVMKMANGEHDFEPMSVSQIRAIRDRSDAYKAFADKKISSTPWSTDEGEMSKKTTIRRIAKRAPQSPELAEAIRIEDAAEFGETMNVARVAAPTPPRPPVPPKPTAVERAPTAPQIEHRAPEAVETPEPEAQPTSPRPPVPPKAKAPEPAKEPDRVDYVDGEPIIIELQAAANDARDEATLNQAWDDIIEPVKAKMMTPDFTEADKIYRKALERIQK